MKSNNHGFCWRSLLARKVMYATGVCGSLQRICCPRKARKSRNTRTSSTEIHRSFLRGSSEFSAKEKNLFAAKFSIGIFRAFRVFRGLHPFRAGIEKPSQAYSRPVETRKKGPGLGRVRRCENSRRSGELKRAPETSQYLSSTSDRL